MATSSKAKKKIVRLASGRKRARQDVKLNAANTSLRSRFRTVVKNVQKAVVGGDVPGGQGGGCDGGVPGGFVEPHRQAAAGRPDGAAGRRQGHLPQEQGRTAEEPPVGQGQGARTGCLNPAPVAIRGPAMRALRRLRRCQRALGCGSSQTSFTGN